MWSLSSCSVVPLVVWQAPSKSLSSCATRAKIQTGPGNSSAEMTNWRSSGSLIAPSSLSPLLMKLHSLPHRSPASHHAGFFFPTRSCNLISHVFSCQTCRCLPGELNCWRDTKTASFTESSYQEISHTGWSQQPPLCVRLTQSHGGGVAMRISAFDRLPGVSLSSMMVMSCVVCLFRLKVISFVAFSSLPSAFAP